MTLNIYAIRDVKSGFMTPTFELNDAVAMRNFEHACLNADSLLFSHFEDFDLYCIGAYDTDTGCISAVPHSFVCSGATALAVKKVHPDA